MTLALIFVLTLLAYSGFGLLSWFVVTKLLGSPLAGTVFLAMYVGLTPIVSLVVYRTSLGVFYADACDLRPSLWVRMFLRSLWQFLRHPMASSRRH